MGRLIYSHHVSLDGYIEGPNGELEWATVDEALYRRFNEQESQIGAHLYGRRTYLSMAAAMAGLSQDPSAPDYMLESAQIWQDKPKIVFSRTLERVEGNARLVRRDLQGEITSLKHQLVKDMLLGGAGLAAGVIPLGLVDEYRLYLNPVLLGAGTPMFPRNGAKARLRLIESTPLGSGVVLLRFAPAPQGS